MHRHALNAMKKLSAMHRHALSGVKTHLVQYTDIVGSKERP